MSNGEFRLRVCYAKRGRLRWLSHLEVVHALERMVRRAGLRFAVTQGFSPHMKIAFGPALPVGTAGENEYLDIWLKEYTKAPDALASLKAAAADDLAPTGALYVANNAKSLTAELVIGHYRVDVDGKGITPEQVQAALAQVFSAGELVVEHKGKQKVFDLARSVPKDACVSDSEGGVSVDLAIRMGPEGSLRPESLVRAAIQKSDIAVSAVRTTRLDTLVEVDEGVWSRPV